MSDELFRIMKKSEDQRVLATGKWTRKNNDVFMRSYSSNLHFRSRLEAIKHYKCNQCGEDDPTKRFGIYDESGLSVGRWMNWPALKRRKWPTEFYLLCSECAGEHRRQKNGRKGGNAGAWNGQWMLMKINGKTRQLVEKWQREAGYRCELGENVTCSVESVLSFAERLLLIRKELRWRGRDPWTDPAVWDVTPFNVTRKYKVA